MLIIVDTLSEVLVYISLKSMKVKVKLLAIN
jgi:hypothetical protein